MGFMQCKAADTSAVSLFCTAPLNSSYRSADRPGAVVDKNSTCTCQYCTHIQQVGEILSSGTNMQQVDSRRSTVRYCMAMPFSISHQHAFGAMPRRASSKQTYAVWPYIEVPYM